MSALGLGGYFEHDDADEESSEEELDQKNSPIGKVNDLKFLENPAVVTVDASAQLDASRAGEQDDVAARVKHAETAGEVVSTPEHTPGGVNWDSPQVVKGTGTDPEGTAKTKAFSVPGVPDAPDEPCEAKWQHRVSWVLQQQSRMGKKMIRELQGNKTYRNPRFMEKVIKDAGVTQYGTCFPQDIWDPDSLPPGDFLKSLKRKLEEKRLKRARQPPAQKPAVHKSGVHPGSMSASAAAGARIAASMGSKRSKWDQGTKER